MSQFQNILFQNHPLWTWVGGVVTAYPFGTPSKSGIMPEDLRNFAGVPLVIRGNPPIPLVDNILLQHIRWAEDYIEQQTGILLCPTSIASPPALTNLQLTAASIIAANGTSQQQGVDYDLQDRGYDFRFNRFEDEGWGQQSLRYKPLRILDSSANAIKLLSYVYPLLNQIFRMPASWIVEDLDNAIFNIVPSLNLQAMPLFAMQLGLFGFSQTVPNGLWAQYTAGLTAADYATRFSMVKQLVLCGAAVSALQSIQGSVNMGLDKTMLLEDGVQASYSYRAGGAYSDLIMQFSKQKEKLIETVWGLVGGPRFEALG